MQQRTNSMAILSLVMGILGFFLLPFIGNIVAIVTGHMARGQIAADRTQGGDGLALGGLILGYFGLISYCAGIVVVVLFWGAIAAFLGIGAAASTL